MVDHLKKEKNKMAKFDYKKWIVENKYGSQPHYSSYQGSGFINEQFTDWPGNLEINLDQTCYRCTGSGDLSEVGTWVTIQASQLLGVDQSTSNIANNASVGEFAYGYCGYGYSNYNQQAYYTSPEAWEAASGSCAASFGGEDNTEPTGSVPPTEPTGSFNTGSMATTGCDGFANLPQSFQDTICQSCENPDYINMHCECCPGESGIASIPTGSMTTGSMAPGMPSQCILI